jgi:hypothetical protein
MSYIGLRKTFTVQVEQDDATGDLFVPVPKELLEELGWIEGDDIQWFENSNGTWTISKVEDDT